MTTPLYSPPPPQRLLVWWFLWFALLVQAVVMYQVIPPTLPEEIEAPAGGAVAPHPLAWIGLGQLFVSVVLRWLVIPRQTEANRALVLFIIGMAMAEGCAILGLFFGGPYRDELFSTGVFGIVQFLPLFARKFFA